MLVWMRIASHNKLFQATDSSTYLQRRLNPMTDIEYFSEQDLDISKQTLKERYGKDVDI